MTEETPTLKLISGAELEAELRVRRSPWLYKRVAASEVPAHEADGWNPRTSQQELGAPSEGEAD